MKIGLRWMVLSMSLIGGPASSWAAPTVPMQIVYQGTLKQKGVPANGLFNMQFAIIDAKGNQIASNTQLAPPPNIQVTNGLFSVQLTIPSSVDWQNVTPYLQISIGGQALSPAQPINANLYSVVSQTVVDGAITVKKLDSAAQNQLIPSGMISMFANTCPPTWQEVTGLRGRFPAGEDPNNPTQFSAAETGGSLNHSHSISTDGSHTHRLADGSFPLQGQNNLSAAVAVIGGAGVDGALVAAGGGGSPAQQKKSITDSSGAHNHGGSTGNASSLPPYMTFIFCQKQ